MILLVLLVLLTSELPDPGKPLFVTLMGAIGYFVAGLIAQVRRLPRDERSHWTGYGMWLGLGIGGGVWMLIIAIDRL